MHTHHAAEYAHQDLMRKIGDLNNIEVTGKTGSHLVSSSTGRAHGSKVVHALDFFERSALL